MIYGAKVTRPLAHQARCWLDRQGPRITLRLRVRGYPLVTDVGLLRQLTGGLRLRAVDVGRVVLAHEQSGVLYWGHPRADNEFEVDYDQQTLSEQSWRERGYAPAGADQWRRGQTLVTRLDPLVLELGPERDPVGLVDRWRVSVGPDFRMGILRSDFPAWVTNTSGYEEHLHPERVKR